MAGVEPSGGVAVSHGVWHAGDNLIPNPPKSPFLVRIVHLQYLVAGNRNLVTLVMRAVRQNRN